LLPTRNVPHAIRIRATFSRLKVRSVPRQKKPYPPLSQVVKTQSEWQWRNVRGTLVGFWFPKYFSGMNLADYHFHFLSDDRKSGGHVLDGQMHNATIELQALRTFKMQLPQNRDFDSADLSTDQTAALHQAETGSSHKDAQ
jgi:acetolactate decarboxylase